MSSLIRWMTAPAIQIAAMVNDTAAVLSRQERYRDVPAVDPNAGLIAEALVDGGFSLILNLLVGVPEPQQTRRGHQELLAMREFLDRNGWLENPRGYHQEPAQLDSPRIVSKTHRILGRRVDYQELSFDSEFEPHPGEPGRERWLSYEENGTAAAFVMEHEGGDRPWLVVAHGFGMGTPTSNFTGLAARWLHEDLGLNLVMPVLPLHGVRSATRVSGGALLQPEFSNVAHMFSQAVWDIRRLVGWIRNRSDAPVGLYGISLGGYTASLASAFIDDLACVIAGIPAVDFTSFARDNEPWLYKAYGGAMKTDWNLVREVIHPVSPLSFEPRVPIDRRFIFAGVADRVARPDQARALWRHWSKPEIGWLPSGHILAAMRADSRPFLRRVVWERLYAKGEAPFTIDVDGVVDVEESPIADAS
jgi:hypothetical protein